MLHRARTLFLGLALTLGACGGGGDHPPAMFTVGGTVEGLAGSGLVLKNSDGASIAVGSDHFTFASALTAGSSYSVSVQTHPSSPSQTCTVENASGTVSTQNVTDVKVTCANIYAVGGTVSGLTGTGFMLRNKNGEALAVSANGSFMFATRLLPGTPYEVTVMRGPKVPVQTCSVTNASGTIANADIADVAVNCETDRLVYVTNPEANEISIYTLNSISGVLAPTDNSPLDTTGWPTTIAFEPSNRFAYTANVSGQTVSAFAADPITGALSLIGTLPAGLTPNEIAIDPLGRFVYVSNFDSHDVSAYAIDASTGALTTIAGSPFALGGMARELTVDLSGKYLYVVNQTASAVQGYTIDPTTGALSPLGSPYPVGNSPFAVTIDHSGRFLYAVSSNDANISGFSLDPATGALTPLAGSPFAASASACSITIDPQNRFAFVPNFVGTLGTVSSFTIAASGALTQISGSPVAAGEGPCSASVDPTGRFVYVASTASHAAFGYSINQKTGALTPLPGSPYNAYLGSSTVVVR
jgi:6-phosphogluconolactonase (cycloisomerase 2 family)